MSADNLRHGAIVVGVIVANVILSGAAWRILGAKSRHGQTAGRVLGATFCMANLGLAVVCVLYILRNGGDWFYAALLIIALVFAFRIGGATVGRYT